MSTTPAAHLARLKVTYPAWSIRQVEPDKGTGYTAVHCESKKLRSLYAPDLDALEAALYEVEIRNPAMTRIQRN